MARVQRCKRYGVRWCPRHRIYDSGNSGDSVNCSTCWVDIGSSNNTFKIPKVALIHKGWRLLKHISIPPPRTEPAIQPGQTWRTISLDVHNLIGIGTPLDPEKISELYVIEDLGGSTRVYV